MANHYYSNGKLMITGEYSVLAGATALAVPVSAGQWLEAVSSPGEQGCITWHTQVKGKHLLSMQFEGLQMKASWLQGSRSFYDTSRGFIRSILLAARELNPDFTGQGVHWEVKTDVSFSLDWGLGSSSSLLSNMAWWAAVDPYDLFFKVSEGSGYDIACARSNVPVLYTYRGQHIKPDVTKVAFMPPFAEKMAFIYSGRKQNSAESIRAFDPSRVDQRHIETISHISARLCESIHLDEFTDLMRQHELLTSGLLDRKPIQHILFRDFKGMVKSLGAWGGDFLLAASDGGYDYMKKYFANKGLLTVFPFRDMVRPHANTRYEKK